ncbi:MAG: YciI family protein [Ignavibacteriaceae bacterium]|nr:YciI family protein [Ignavibacteriaceae bacterium]
MENIFTDEVILDTVSKGKQYTLFLYKAGPNRDQPVEEEKKLQMAHLHFLFSLRAEGKLILNGPVTDETDLRGIGIFNMTDKKEIEEIISRDPAVKAGRLTYEIYSWFGIPGDNLH